VFTRRSLISPMLLFLATATLVAQAPAIDLKLGLWEQTILTKLGGLPPGIDTSKIPPAQLAQMMAALGEQPMTTRTCITKEDLADESFMLESQPDVKCKRTLTTNTRTSYAAEITCTGARTTKGVVSIQATSNEAFTGTMQMASTQDGKTTNVSMKLTGKYVGAACGNGK
jgi:hypothetical protein